MRRDWNVRVLHTLREGNRVADALAGVGMKMEQFWVRWVEPSSCIKRLLFEDNFRTFVTS